jgi:hypothetical protein
MRREAGRLTVALVAVLGAVVGFAPAANAATAAGSGAVKPACPAAVSAADRQANLAMAGTVAGARAATTAKAPNVLSLAPRPSAAELAAAATHDARKAQYLAGRSPSTACGARVASPMTGSGQISWMYQYAQVTSYFCGPAVVSEMSATTPGTSPYNLDQWTAANYMGTTTGGTNYAQETNGLNHFVGIPDFGWGFYGMAWMSDPPSAQQDTDFSNHLAADVAQSSPVAGLAYEVAGGPHLVGHPVNQTIGHWLQIGGYNASQVWYSDSATSVWSSVPRYSWFDTNTMEIILGGAGYIW